MTINNITFDCNLDVFLGKLSLYFNQMLFHQLMRYY